MTVGTPARATSAASWSGPEGSRCEEPAISRTDSSARSSRRSSNGIGSIDQTFSHSTSMPSSWANFRDAASALLNISASHVASRWRWSSRHSAVSTTEVTIPGFVTTAPIVQTAPPPTRFAMSRISSSSFAAPVHRRRAGVGSLAAERDLVALDAERAEDHAERQVERLEHRALLDVELEVRSRVLELPPRLERPVEVDAVLADRVRQRDPVDIAPLAQLVLVAHRAGGRRGAEQRAAEAGALLVGPAHEPHGQRRRPLFGDAPQHLDGREHVEAAVEPASVRHGIDVAAEQERALRLARQREPLVPGLVDLLLGADRHDLLAQPLARALPRLRPGDTLSAVLVAGQLLQLPQLRDRPFR